MEEEDEGVRKRRVKCNTKQTMATRLRTQVRSAGQRATCDKDDLGLPFKWVKWESKMRGEMRTRRREERNNDVSVEDAIETLTRVCGSVLWS